MADMNFQQFIDRMMADRDFRTAMRKDPEAALKANGVEPTEQMVTALKAFNYDQVSAVQKAFARGRLMLT
jgi:hypothetical protein